MQVYRGDNVKTLMKFGLIQCKTKHSVGDNFNLVATGVLSSEDNYLLFSEYDNCRVRAQIGEAEG